MPLVGTLQFCQNCGNILDRRDPAHQTTIHCDICNNTNKNLWPTTLTSQTANSAFPSALKNQASHTQSPITNAIQTWASIQIACPNCENPETRYRDLQMRGADEGSTVFYYCERCGYRDATKN